MVISIGAVLALAACTSAQTSGSDDATGAQSSQSRNLNVAIAAMPTSFDLDSDWAATPENYTMWSQTQIGLLNYATKTENGITVPDFTKFTGALAVKNHPYTVSDHGQTYTFHLRHNVLSQAGNPLTAEDVYWSVDRKLHDNGVGLTQISAYFSSMSQVKIINKYTIAFHLNGAGNDNVFLPIFTGQTGKIYDKVELMKHATTSDPWATKWSATHTGWGFGPYEIESETAGQQITLKANPHYPDGKVAYKTITMKVVPDSGTRAQLLASGAVQVAENLTPSDQKSISSSPNVQIPTVKNPTEFVDLALIDNKAPFNSQLVREAFMYAIPYKQIISNVFEGRAKQLGGWITPAMGVPGISTKPAYSLDVAKAKSLLSQAGVTSPVDVNLVMSNAAPTLVDTAILIKGAAEKAGFDVTVDQENPGDFATGELNHSFQAIMIQNRSQVQVPSFVNNFFNPGDPSNFSDYTPTAQYKAAYQAAVDAGAGSSKAAAPYWQKYNNLVNELALSLPILYTQPAHAYSKDLTGISYRYDSTVGYSLLAPKK